MFFLQILLNAEKIVSVLILYAAVFFFFYGKFQTGTIIP